MQDLLRIRQRNNDRMLNFAYQALVIFSLRDILELAVQMIYTALVGGDLIVLNNDNIIAIDKNFNNLLYEGLSILTVDIEGLFRSGIGGIALIDCDITNNYRLKKFGRIDQLKFSTNREEGPTISYNIRVIDENMNPWSSIFR